MWIDLAFMAALAGMAAASYSCRVAGFVLMAWVRVTPRVESALRAVPLAVMVGIVTPAATSGSAPETLALLVVVLAMRIVGNDLVAALAGAATAGLARYLGLGVYS